MGAQASVGACEGAVGAIALLGVEERGAEDRRIDERARRLQRFLTQPFTVTEGFSGQPGRSVALADKGECDAWRESSF